MLRVLTIALLLSSSVALGLVARGQEGAAIRANSTSRRPTQGRREEEGRVAQNRVDPRRNTAAKIRELRRLNKRIAELQASRGDPRTLRRLRDRRSVVRKALARDIEVGPSRRTARGSAHHGRGDQLERRELRGRRENGDSAREKPTRAEKQQPESSPAEVTRKESVSETSQPKLPAEKDDGGRE